MSKDDHDSVSKHLHEKSEQEKLELSKQVKLLKLKLQKHTRPQTVRSINAITIFNEDEDPLIVMMKE